MKRESSKPPTIPCPTCHGSGRVHLGEQYCKTLAIAKELGHVTTEQVHQRIGANSKTAANNWLETLRKLGFVRRKKKNRRWVYTPTLP